MANDTGFVPARNASTDGEFVRDATYINDRVVAGLEPGSAPVGEKIGEMRWPVEAGRYRLMAARACPWASRTIIVRRLLGLEDAISMGLAGPTHDINSWTFDLDPDGRDPVTGLERLQQAYFNRIPDYPRGITVPVFSESSVVLLATVVVSLCKFHQSISVCNHVRNRSASLFESLLGRRFSPLARPPSLG